MDYGSDIAAQYKAYRPPLHSLILSEIIGTGQRFESVVDIGCGVGHSSLALLAYCELVAAIDPSQAMIDVAIPHKQIEYFCSTLQEIEFNSESFDLISLAGSLNYCHSEAFIDELARIINPTGTILIYDFDVNLDKVFDYLDIEKESSGYDHDLGLDIKEQHRFTLKQSISEDLLIEISIENIVHLLLADPQLHSEYSTEKDIYQYVYEQLKGINCSSKLEISVKIYGFKYE